MQIHQELFLDGSSFILRARVAMEQECTLRFTAGTVTGETSNDLPPDLALEVDIANRSNSKLSIYQAIGVPEIWLVQHSHVKIKHLENGVYVDASASRADDYLSKGDQLDVQWS